MDVQVTGKNMNVGDALRGRIATELEQGVEKYFDRGGSANVTVMSDGAFYRVDATVNLASGQTLIGHGQAGDAHAAFSDALTKIEKRVRRYKRKLRNHKSPGVKGFNPGPEETVPLVVLAAPQDDGDDDTEDFSADFEGIVSGEPQPMIIAESSTPLPTLTVAMAVLELDLRGYPVVPFRNAGTGAASVVYRRPDGNIGWIDMDARTRKSDAKAA